MTNPLTIEQPVGVIGLGLIGGAVVRGLRAIGADCDIIAVDPDPKLTTTIGQGLNVQIRSTVDQAIGGARTIIVATPFAGLAGVLGALAAHARPEALVTDVIGVKVAVARMVARLLPKAAFVGAHPLAGGERGGFANSRADLFRGSRVAVCSDSPAGELQIQRVEGLWRSLGADPIRVSAVQHDQMVALTSHVPYLLGLALTRLVDSTGERLPLAGPSFRDLTKRVRFQPEVMAAAVARNPFVAAALRRLGRECERLADLIADDPAALVEAARTVRTGYDALCAELLAQP